MADQDPLACLAAELVVLSLSILVSNFAGCIMFIRSPYAVIDPDPMKEVTIESFIARICIRILVGVTPLYPTAFTPSLAVHHPAKSLGSLSVHEIEPRYMSVHGPSQQMSRSQEHT